MHRLVRRLRGEAVLPSSTEDIDGRIDVSATSAATVATTLNIAAGATSAKFKITTSAVSSAKTVTITSSANGSSKSATLTVTH